MESIWEYTSDCDKFVRLNTDMKTDALIIGGGICGVLCAYLLE